jgi:hypothetical protein
VCKGRLWRRALPSIVAPLGNLEGCSYTGYVERRMEVGSRNGASLSRRVSSMRGTWWEGSFTGDPERYAKQGSGNGSLLPQGPRFWGTWRDATFLGPLTEVINFFI